MTLPQEGEAAIRIHARCPLRHEHCIPMNPSFQGWLEGRQHTTIEFFLSCCPWGVELEASSRDSCPHCGQQLRNGRFCCAFPLEDEDE